MSDALQSAFSSLGRLSSREQAMVIVLVVAVLLATVGGVTYFVGQRLDRAERRLTERREFLTQIEALEGQYRGAEREHAQQIQKLQRNPVQLFSLLNRVASELGLKLDNLNERHSPIKEAGVDEVSVDVTLKDMSITKLNKFLEKLEGPPNTGLVKITKLKVKTSFKNEEMLDINMTVSTYRLLGAAPPGAPGAAPDEEEP